MAVLLVVGCGSSPPVTPATGASPGASPSSSQGQPSVSPLATGPATGVPSASPPAPSATPGSTPGGTSEPAGLVLAEVLFNPTPGSSPFVEILNTGAVALPLAGVSLRFDGGTVAIDSQQSSLGPGERMLIMFDPSKPAPGRAAGVADLVDSAGYLLDRVAWGDGQPNAVSLTVGDFEPDAIEPGSTIGRPPGAIQPIQPTEWVIYESDLASGGVPNPVPPVEVLLPLDGAVLEGPGQTVQWYPALGAASYRVQIASDDTFSSPVVDTTVTDPQLEISSLAPGTYSWQVTSIAADGSTSANSAPSRFELSAGTASLEALPTRDASRPYPFPSMPTRSSRS